MKSELESLHANKIANLKAEHMARQNEIRSNLKYSSEQELAKHREAAKLAHSTAVKELKSELESVERKAELRCKQLEQSRQEEIEALKSAVA